MSFLSKLFNGKSDNHTEETNTDSSISTELEKEPQPEPKIADTDSTSTPQNSYSPLLNAKLAETKVILGGTKIYDSVYSISHSGKGDKGIEVLFNGGKIYDNLTYNPEKVSKDTNKQVLFRESEGKGYRLDTALPIKPNLKDITQLLWSDTSSNPSEQDAKEIIQERLKGLTLINTLEWANGSVLPSPLKKIDQTIKNYNSTDTSEEYYKSLMESNFISSIIDTKDFTPTATNTEYKNEVYELIKSVDNENASIGHLLNILAYSELQSKNEETNSQYHNIISTLDFNSTVILEQTDKNGHYYEYLKSNGKSVLDNRKLNNSKYLLYLLSVVTMAKGLDLYNLYDSETDWDTLGVLKPDGKDDYEETLLENQKEVETIFANYTTLKKWQTSGTLRDNYNVGSDSLTFNELMLFVLPDIYLNMEILVRGNFLRDTNPLDDKLNMKGLLDNLKKSYTLIRETILKLVKLTEYRSQLQSDFKYNIVKDEVLRNVGILLGNLEFFVTQYYDTCMKFRENTLERIDNLGEYIKELEKNEILSHLDSIMEE